MQNPCHQLSLPLLYDERAIAPLVIASVLGCNQWAWADSIAFAALRTGGTWMQALQQEMAEQAGALRAPCSAFNLSVVACSSGLVLANSVIKVLSICAAPYDDFLHFVSLLACFTGCAAMQHSASQTHQEPSNCHCAGMM